MDPWTLSWSLGWTLMKTNNDKGLGNNRVQGSNYFLEKGKGT